MSVGVAQVQGKQVEAAQVQVRERQVEAAQVQVQVKVQKGYK